MITDTLSNSKPNPTVIELFINYNYVKKKFLLFLLHSLIFLYQKNIRLNCTHFFYCEDSKQMRAPTSCI